MLLSLCCSVVIMLYCYCVALLLFVLSYVLIVCSVPLPPGVNPIAVGKYINIYVSCVRNWLIWFFAVLLWFDSLMIVLCEPKHKRMFSVILLYKYLGNQFVHFFK